jgi:CshA-type fibril repeat protein
MPAADVICTAQYTPNPTYQLSYDAGAGSGPVPTTVTGLNPSDTPTLAAGTGLTPPANQTFTGWNCDNNIGAKSAGSTATMPSANVICTAQFAPNSPEISPASVEVKDATNDSSVGRQGARQILQPLANDTLFNSSKWMPSSMRLCSSEESAPNCTRRKLTVDGEGTYVVDSTGRVTFTPEPDFVGKATRVKYQVTNTAGRVVTANINITVSGENLPKSGNNPQLIVMWALLLVLFGATLTRLPFARPRSA